MQWADNLEILRTHNINNYWSIEKSISLIEAYEQEILLWDPLFKLNCNDLKYV